MRSIVSAPDLRRASHGLVEAGNRVDPGSGRWESGVTFTPVGCEAIYGHVPFCPGEEKSPFFDCTGPVEASPWLLELGLVWATGDLGADPKARLREAFDIGTSSVLERLTAVGIADVAAGTPIAPPVSSGTVSTTGITGRIMGTGVAPPVLTDVAQSVGAALTFASHAIGMVETKLVDAADHIGGAGTLLMSPLSAAAALDSLVERNGQLVTRATGSTVIVGNFAPADTVYGVLGDVDVYLGEVMFLETHERSLNEWVGRAERYAVAVFNPCAVYSATWA